MRTDITLYMPAGDGVSKNSHTINYKGIKEFTKNGNGTVTFKTQKGVEICTPLFWRTKTGSDEQLDQLAKGVDEPTPVHGNQGGHHW